LKINNLKLKIMCNFKSAIVLKNGDLLHSPWTDNHEDLIDLFQLNDNTLRQNFVRVEYNPIGEIDELSKYNLKIDESNIPDWFEKVKEKAERKLAVIVKNMIVKDNKKILIGNAFIVCGNAKIKNIKTARIISICGSAQVKYICDSARIIKDNR